MARERGGIAEASTGGEADVALGRACSGLRKAWKKDKHCVYCSLIGLRLGARVYE